VILDSPASPISDCRSHLFSPAGSEPFTLRRIRYGLNLAASKAFARSSASDGPATSGFKFAPSGCRLRHHRHSDDMRQWLPAAVSIALSEEERCSRRQL